MPMMRSSVRAVMKAPSTGPSDRRYGNVIVLTTLRCSGGAVSLTIRIPSSLVDRGLARRGANPSGSHRGELLEARRTMSSDGGVFEQAEALRTITRRPSHMIDDSEGDAAPDVGIGQVVGR